MMNAKEKDRLIRLLNNPPLGSKLAAAKDYGIDLTLFVRTLDLSATERLQELTAAQEFFAELRRSMRRNR